MHISEKKKRGNELSSKVEHQINYKSMKQRRAVRMRRVAGAREVKGARLEVLGRV